MKILVVTNDFPPRVGGINYYVDHIMRRFSSGEVVVFASSWPGAAEFDPTFPHPVIRWPHKSMQPTPAVTRRVIEVIRAEQPDVVLFGATFPLGLMGPALRRATGVPYAGFTHGVEIGAARAARPVFGHIGRNAALLTTVSEWCRGHLRRAVGPATPIEILLPGIEQDLFHPGVDDAPIRARHQIGDGPVIACVSRLVARKGQDTVIRAMPRILAAYPDARFLVVGGGPYGGRLRALARELRVDDAVVFAGQVSYADLPAYFRAGDVFAMPCRSRWAGFDVEALGAVYYQAYAVGRPCVGGDSGGAPEAVRDGETGFVAPGADPAAVGDRILELLDDPERARKMGEAGAAWVHAEITWDAIQRRLRTLLSDSLKA